MRVARCAQHPQGWKSPPPPDSQRYDLRTMRGPGPAAVSSGGHASATNRSFLLLSHIEDQLELVNQRRGRELWEASQARLLARPTASTRPRIRGSIDRLG